MRGVPAGLGLLDVLSSYMRSYLLGFICVLWVFAPISLWLAQSHRWTLMVVIFMTQQSPIYKIMYHYLTALLE